MYPHTPHSMLALVGTYSFEKTEEEAVPKAEADRRFLALSAVVGVLRIEPSTPTSIDCLLEPSDQMTLGPKFLLEIEISYHGPRRTVGVGAWLECLGCPLLLIWPA
ncbi:hypothetical protein ACLOJK_026045 [Asimina triloba]